MALVEFERHGADENPADHPLDVALRLNLRGQLEEGEEILRRMQHSDLRAQFNLAWFEARQGLWHNCSIMLDAGRFMNCYGAPRLENGKPIWNEEPLEGKTVHLRCEGGFGDEIIGLRWAQNFAARGARVHVSCSTNLMELFARAPGVTAVTECRGANYVHCDYWVPAMSGMRWFEPTGKPYLKPDLKKAERWFNAIPKASLRVGLRWAGNPKFEGQQYRKFNSELMLRLVDLRPDIQFYSLQVGNDLVELPSGVVDLHEGLTDWDETAAAIRTMDLVITSCTGVAHCAAAIGVPTWVVVPVMPYYLWAVPGERTQWYDSVTLFRQQKFGVWHHPFDEIAERLSTWRT